jgi:hypothetical protein
MLHRFLISSLVLLALLIWVKGGDRPVVLPGVNMVVFGLCSEMGAGSKYTGECVSFIIEEIVYVMPVERLEMIKFVSDGGIM